jgi:hypothetical protein
MEVPVNGMDKQKNPRNKMQKNIDSTFTGFLSDQLLYFLKIQETGFTFFQISVGGSSLHPGSL